MTHVVIVGMGFGGLSAARALARRRGIEVTIIDRNNYHLFQPLLYQVATASLEQEAIAYPGRAILRGWRNARFLLAEVTGVDFKRRQVKTDQGQVGYDHLIVAAGAVTGFFGLRGVEKHSFQLKGLFDAVVLRNHILSLFEQASREADPDRRAALLTFVIVGGGPTGVEFTGALAELVRQVMARDYPEIGPGQVRIALVEATNQLLPMVPHGLRGYALRRLERLGVQVRLGAKIVEARSDRVILEGGEVIPTFTIQWAAGVKAAPLAEKIDGPKARAGRIAVRPDLTLPDHPDVYVVGDMAYLEQDGAALPTIAPVAIQQGAYAGKSILRGVAGGSLPPFRYLDKGAMAVIGRGAAVASAFGLTFSGVLAWVVWLALHLFYLIGFRNRLVVLLNWAYDYLFFDRKIRLITWSKKGTHSH